MKHKHSPLPWVLCNLTDIFVDEVSGGQITDCFVDDKDMPLKRARANAQFIVTACNSYYKMRLMLAKAINIMEMATWEDSEACAIATVFEKEVLYFLAKGDPDE